MYFVYIAALKVATFDRFSSKSGSFFFWKKLRQELWQNSSNDIKLPFRGSVFSLKLHWGDEYLVQTFSERDRGDTFFAEPLWSHTRKINSAYAFLLPTCKSVLVNSLFSASDKKFLMEKRVLRLINATSIQDPCKRHIRDLKCPPMPALFHPSKPSVLKSNQE